MQKTIPIWKSWSDSSNKKSQSGGNSKKYKIKMSLINDKNLVTGSMIYSLMIIIKFNYILAYLLFNITKFYWYNEFKI